MDLNGYHHHHHHHCRRHKVIVILGPTGSGKSRLSIQLATHFNCEIINSDKIQLYKGLNLTTNKIPLHQQLGVHHHLLDQFDSTSTELTPSMFRSLASSAISSIIDRGKTPIIAGGSNSFAYALLSENFDPDLNVFSGSDSDCLVMMSSKLRYDCCFLWIDVSLPVLMEYLKKRVDEMVDSGMVTELAEFYNSEEMNNSVLRKAIGVTEFEKYFRLGVRVGEEEEEDEQQTRRNNAFDEAVKETKDNTCQLAKNQMEKIQRLKMGGWNLNKLDGTDSLRAVVDESGCWSDIWEREVVAPCINIVTTFLLE